MSRPIRIEVNCATGEQTEIELTDEEIARLEADRMALQAQRAEQEALEAEKLQRKNSAIAKLTALGLTEDEIAAL